MCAVPRSAVLWISCRLLLPGISQSCLLVPFLITPRAPTTMRITTVLICHMKAISVSKSLYLGGFSDTLKEVFLSDGMATSIRVNLFSRSFFITMSGQFAVIIIIIIIISIIIIIIIISTVTAFADVLFVHQPGCKPCS